MTSQASYTPTQDLSAWRDQFRLTHTFHIVLGSNELTTGQLESTLKSANAHVDKWVISRRGGCYEHCITVDGIGDDSARDLRREFASLDGKIKVHVEHMVHFGAETAHR